MPYFFAQPLNTFDEMFPNELKKIKNFATLEIYQTKILLNVKLNPDNFSLTESLRDVREIGHWGCGDLQLILKSEKEMNLAKELLQKAYDEN